MCNRPLLRAQRRAGHACKAPVSCEAGKPFCARTHSRQNKDTHASPVPLVAGQFGELVFAVRLTGVANQNRAQGGLATVGPPWTPDLQHSKYPRP